MVADVLDSAIRKVDRVRTINNTSSIIVLSLLECSTGVVISNSVGVRIWGNLSKVISNIPSLHWGMDGMNSMGDNSISTVKSVGGISNNSSMGTKSLALCCASVFSLVWFANRLMADLSVSISINWSVSSIVDGSNGAGDWSWEDWGMDGTVGHKANSTGAGSSQDGAQTQESPH